MTFIFESQSTEVKVSIIAVVILKRIFSPVPPNFLSTTSENIRPRISEILLNKYDFPPELASRVSSQLTDFESPEKVDSALSFFRENGFSNSQLAKILKYNPRFLAANVENTLKPKIKIFQEFGFSNVAICKILSSNPPLLHSSVNGNIIPSLSAIKGLLGSDYEVNSVIGSASRSLSVNIESRLLPNVELLKSCGVSMDRIRIMFASHPNSFLLKTQVIRKSVEKVKELGLNPSSKSFIYAILAIASMRNEVLELRLQGYRDMGFSGSDVLFMFKKSPRMIMGSMEKQRKIKELLLSTGKYNLLSIVDYPLSLSFSIEKRYKPRLQILEDLESRKLINKWPGLGTLCRVTDNVFCKRFISPYLNEIRDVEMVKKFYRGKDKDEA